jgi:hypothetical protein
VNLIKAFWLLIAAVAVLIVLWSCSALASVLPDPARTPGAINPDVTQANIGKTICVAGWTNTMRPPASYTNRLKAKQIKELGLKDTKLTSYEEDHHISIELGGHPTDPRNLWPQEYAGACGARTKDVVETKLKQLVCSGTITLKTAQQAIATDWVKAYRAYVGELKCK